VKKLNRVVWN